MPKRQIFLLDSPSSPWKELLGEFLEETASSLTHVPDAIRFAALLESSRPDLLFVHSGLLTLTLAQKLKTLSLTRPEMRFFRIGAPGKMGDSLTWQACFDEIPELPEFQKQIVQHLPFAEKINVLIVDDEPEISRTMRDFMEYRTRPAFEIAYAENGKKGLEAILQKKPDILVLDVKMPVLDGREVYRELREKKTDLPVIIFFDAVSGDELVEIRRFGQPAVVEKGSHESSMPEMMTFMKKLVFFA